MILNTVRRAISLLGSIDVVGGPFAVEALELHDLLSSPEFGAELRARVEGALLVREMHRPGPDGLCLECFFKSPCRTVQAVTAGPDQHLSHTRSTSASSQTPSSTRA